MIQKVEPIHRSYQTRNSLDRSQQKGNRFFQVQLCEEAVKVTRKPDYDTFVSIKNVEE